MNVSGALQTGLIGLNRTADNVPKAASDFAGSGQPLKPDEASGRQSAALKAVEETTQAGNEVASTQVVSEVSDTQESNRVGGRIDLHV